MELAGCGDASLGEWREWTGYAIHLRRRLDDAETSVVDLPLDIRGTPEARERAGRIPARLRALIPAGALNAEIYPDTREDRP